MIIFSLRLENYQFSQPRQIFLIYRNAIYVFSILVKSLVIRWSIPLIELIWLTVFLHFPDNQEDWLFVWCLTPFSSVFQLYHCGQCTYTCFPRGFFLTSTPQNVLPKPLAAFPHKHCRNEGQRWQKRMNCHNDYHQSSEWKLAQPGIEPMTSGLVCFRAMVWIDPSWY